MSGPLTRRASLKRIAFAAAACSLPDIFRPVASYGADVPPQPTPTDAEHAAIANVAQQFMDKFQVPGLSVAVARHGQFVYSKGFGLADTSGEKLTPSHLFRIASVTKPITSVAIFTLVEQDRLKLSDLVFGADGLLRFDYAAAYPELVKKITVEHLLTHTCGGWSNDANDPMFHDSAMAVGDLITWTIDNLPLQNEPGSHYAYSNFGFCLLGRIIEKISGKHYDDFVRLNVLEKCGIKDMRLAGNTRSDRAAGEVIYYGQYDEDPYCLNIRRMDSHGGWIATPTDLVQFALRVDGFGYVPNILTPSTIRTMTTPSAAFSHYAKGWCVNEVANWWHLGSLPGTTTVLVRTASGLCWAAFANTRAPEMDGAIDRMVWDMVKAVPAWKA